MLRPLRKLLLNQEYQTLNLIEVSQRALVSNFNYFQKISPGKKIAPVLKSNAYGHGLDLVAKVIDNNLSAPYITVDSLYEAYELRKAGIKTKPLIIGYTNPENFKIGPLINYCLPVYDLLSAKIIARFQPRADVHLKIDSGMNRLGIQPKQARQFAKQLKKIKKLNVTGIYSHLSQSADLNKEFTHNQIQTFKQVIKVFEQEGCKFRWKHISATSGAKIVNDKEFNLIRLGLGFYGVSPFLKNSSQTAEFNNNLKPALKLLSHLAAIKTVPAGAEVGYGGTYVAKQKTKLGILPLGYYEGVDRRLSNKGVVSINNTPCPIVGRVCMNLTIIDLTRVDNAKIGDPVVVYSNQTNQPNSIAHLAEQANTIPYVLLVNLAESIRRQLI